MKHELHNGNQTACFLSEFGLAFIADKLANG